jgi:hypothetical protein
MGTRPSESRSNKPQPLTRKQALIRGNTSGTFREFMPINVTQHSTTQELSTIQGILLIVISKDVDKMLQGVKFSLRRMTIISENIENVSESDCELYDQIFGPPVGNVHRDLIKVEGACF